MKRFLTGSFVFLLMLCVCSTVLFAGSGTSFNAGSNYDANSPYFSIGNATAKVFKPVTGSFVTPTVSGAFSSQTVKSDAWALGPCGRPERAEAYGDAYQWSEADVNPTQGTWATGGQGSGAGYSAVDYGNGFAAARGTASTIGGTLVGATRSDIGLSSTSMAGAITGSAGSAYANCNNYDTYTFGAGSVAHGTYVNKGVGQAWTNGTASYAYETNGDHFSSGSGFAATGGISNVTYTRTGIMATAKSISYSTSGTTNASGGVNINNIQ